MIEKNIVNNSNNKLINEGRGSEAALLKIYKKIKIFEKIWETYSNTVAKNFQAGGLQIFLDENEANVFGTDNMECQKYQRGFAYSWEYKKYI